MIEEILNKYDKIYPIRIDMPGAGFGAVILTTMNMVRYCERNNFYPIVSYDKNCKTAFLDSEYGNELWEQYFEPVMPLSHAEFQTLVDQEGQQLLKSKVFRLSTEEAIKISEENPESVFTFPFGKWRMEELGDLDLWYDMQRGKGHETISKYIRPKAHILQKVSDFYDRHFSECFVLGLHVRGTDMNYAPTVSPAEYFSHIDQYIKQKPNLKIFLATDQAQYIEVFSSRYKDRVVFADCFRSDNEIAPFERTGSSPYKKGEDVLLDILLLSKSDFLIKGGSNVGEMALYFNSELDCLDLSYKKYRSFGQRYDQKWDRHSNPTAWQLVSKRGLDSVARDASSQSIVQTAAYEFRKWLKKARMFLGKIKGKILSSP